MNISNISFEHPMDKLIHIMWINMFISLKDYINPFILRLFSG